MKYEFEEIFQNYLNGNRGDARKAFEKLGNSSMADFRAWFRSQYEMNDRDHDLTEFILFLLTA